MYSNSAESEEMSQELSKSKVEDEKGTRVSSPPLPPPPHPSPTAAMKGKDIQTSLQAMSMDDPGANACAASSPSDYAGSLKIPAKDTTETSTPVVSRTGNKMFRSPSDVMSPATQKINELKGKKESPSLLESTKESAKHVAETAKEKVKTLFEPIAPANMKSNSENESIVKDEKQEADDESKSSGCCR